MLTDVPPVIKILKQQATCADPEVDGGLYPPP